MGKEEVLTATVSVAVIILLAVAAIAAIQNVPDFSVLKSPAAASAAPDAASAASATALAAGLLQDVDVPQSVTDWRELVTISSIGGMDGCNYNLSFNPRLGLPDIGHYQWRAPQEQGGRMGVSECTPDGRKALYDKALKYLEKNMDRLGKSLKIQKVVLEALKGALEEILGAPLY